MTATHKKTNFALYVNNVAQIVRNSNYPRCVYREVCKFISPKILVCTQYCKKSQGVHVCRIAYYILVTTVHIYRVFLYVRLRTDA